LKMRGNNGVSHSSSVERMYHPRKTFR